LGTKRKFLNVKFLPWWTKWSFYPYSILIAHICWSFEFTHKYAKLAFSAKLKTSNHINFKWDKCFLIIKHLSFANWKCHFLSSSRNSSKLTPKMPEIFGRQRTDEFSMFLWMWN
jgi:hypothetical protein